MASDSVATQRPRRRVYQRGHGGIERGAHHARPTRPPPRLRWFHRPFPSNAPWPLTAVARKSRLRRHRARRSAPASVTGATTSTVTRARSGVGQRGGGETIPYALNPLPPTHEQVTQPQPAVHPWGWGGVGPGFWVNVSMRPGRRL